MNINNLVIEITRQCNLQCDHCLRGEAQDRVIQNHQIEALFNQIEYISTLTITGGEPALHPEKIMVILQIAQRLNIRIGSFYIATNGTIASDAFIKALLDLWCYCVDNEVSMVDISNDVYHEFEYDDPGLIAQNIKRLQALSFVELRDADNYDYGNGRFLLAEGRGEMMGEKLPREPDFDIEDSSVYLNCNGEIINGCDWSYENQEYNIVCLVTELYKFAREAEAA